MIHNHPRPPFVCLPVSTTSFYNSKLADPRRTALREAAYIRRTRFTKEGMETIDFSCRSGDLFMLLPVLPAQAPDWVAQPFMRWKRADEAAEASNRPDEIRAWHICADLPEGLSKGQWVDHVESMVRAATPNRIVAEIAVHLPADKPPHAHVLVSSRYAGRNRYGGVAYDLHKRLDDDLRILWMRWLREQPSNSLTSA